MGAALDRPSVTAWRETRLTTDLASRPSGGRGTGGSGREHVDATLGARRARPLVIGADAGSRAFSRARRIQSNAGGSLSATVLPARSPNLATSIGMTSNDLRSTHGVECGLELGRLGRLQSGWRTLNSAPAIEIGGSRFGAAHSRPSDQIKEVYAPVSIRDPEFVPGWKWDVQARFRRAFLYGSIRESQDVGAERARLGRRIAPPLIEAANLEQPTDVRGWCASGLYTSADIQGWSQRGQSTWQRQGPGAQSQWHRLTGSRSAGPSASSAMRAGTRTRSSDSILRIRLGTT
jgi:hypothetical protein